MLDGPDNVLECLEMWNVVRAADGERLQKTVPAHGFAGNNSITSLLTVKSRVKLSSLLTMKAPRCV